MKKLSLILAIILAASIVGCVHTGIAFAATSDIYTGVLEDLQNDESFDVSEFPAKPDDYSLNLFQIAESNARELFLYVYQPSEDKVTASEVRISTTIGDNLSPRDYKLTLLDRSGTLAKYKVDELQVKNDPVRYYSIIQIGRPYNSELDLKFHQDAFITGATTSINRVDTTTYPVAKLFTAFTSEEGVSYIEEHNEVITVTDKWFGFIRYSNGFKLYKDSCDAWFIAFNTDMPIDKLFDADVSYLSQKFRYGWSPSHGWFAGAGSEIEPTGPHVVKLTDKDVAETKADGLFAYKYKWNRIESVEDFKKNEKLSEDYIKNLKGKTWVLRFTETDYDYYMSTYTGTENYTEISEVTILRLHFKSNGKTYNLGVVDNKMSNADGPVNDDTEAIDGAKRRFEEFLDKLEAFWDKVGNFFQRVGLFFKKYWWVVLIFVALIVLGILSIFIKPLAKVLWWALKIIFYIVTLPVWIIIWIVRAVKRRRERHG